MSWKEALYNFLPNNASEIFLFIITVVLVYIIIQLFSYTSIQNKIKQSRCYRDRVLNRPGVGVYTAYAMSNDGIKLYETVYDFGAKTVTVNQLCKPGNVINTIPVPIYDLSTNTPKSIDKVFNCEENYSTDRIIYGGYPGIVKFMMYSNTDFFDKMIGIKG